MQLTRELLEKRDRLLALLTGWGRVGVAFSGGVDSAVVACAARHACGDAALAITAVSPSLASGEQEAAEELARRIGIRHQVLFTQEFSNPDYLQNAPNRCYYCKSELYGQVASQWRTLDIDVLVNGTNTDDLGDFRPGLRAADEHGVRSPLVEVGLCKAEVRELARHWDLPVWDKPASPCLSSRIAHGVEVTPERIARVDAAEMFLKQELGLRELRVRHEAHDLARIELPLSHLARLAEAEVREKITSRFHALGFRYVTLDLEGFRSGSLNPLVTLDAEAFVLEIRSDVN